MHWIELMKYNPPWNDVFITDEFKYRSICPIIDLSSLSPVLHTELGAPLIFIPQSLQIGTFFLRVLSLTSDSKHCWGCNSVLNYEAEELFQSYPQGIIYRSYIIKGGFGLGKIHFSDLPFVSNCIGSSL